MKPNTIIKLPDGRIGTVCWHHADGYGGVWGEYHFQVERDFDDNFPSPVFMLREKSAEGILRKYHPDIECVGTEYERMEAPDERAEA